MLVKSMLGSLGIYYLSIFKTFVALCHKLESLRSRFFWDAEDRDQICIGLSGMLFLALDIMVGCRLGVWLRLIKLCFISGGALFYV